jgi:hypothetical protein
MAAEYSAPACTAHKSLGIVQIMHRSGCGEAFLIYAPKESDEDDGEDD